MAASKGDDQLALEDRPVGKPVSFGPQMPADTNPFWSERVREDASLMAMRPTFLPAIEGNTTGQVAAEGTMEVAHLATCRVERVAPVASLDTMSPEVRRNQGNRDVPSPEQIPGGGELTEVLKAILFQNQVLAREVASLKQRMDGEPSRDHQTPVLVTPSSSAGVKNDEEGKGEGKVAIEHGRLSPVGVGVGARQSVVCIPTLPTVPVRRGWSLEESFRPELPTALGRGGWVLEESTHSGLPGRPV